MKRWIEEKRKQKENKEKDMKMYERAIDNVFYSLPSFFL